MKKTMIAVFATAALSLVATSEPIFPNFITTVKASSKTVSNNAQFFEKYGEMASKVGEETDLFASVMLAQMALESNYGKSGLSREPINNLFGIKGFYNGESVALATKEDDGEGNLYEIIDNFRKYPSPVESMSDYARLLNTKTYNGVNKSSANSYEEVTQRLQGTYATDTKYASKLNYIISTYDLTRFDNHNGIHVEGSELYEEHQKFLRKATFEEYQVKLGDTLFEIAEDHGVELDNLYSLNNLTSDLILVGQMLKIKELTPIYDEYIVKDGDSIKVLSERYKATEEYLQAINSIDSKGLKTGEKIKVPHLKKEQKLVAKVELVEAPVLVEVPVSFTFDFEDLEF